MLITPMKRTGTYLHSSGAAHANALAKALDKYTVSEAEIEAFIKAYPFKVKAFNTIHEGAPSKLINMNLEEGLMERLRRELLLRSRIDALVMNTVPGTYVPISTQFENSLLFLPSAQQFYLRNRDLLHETFPEAYTSVVNAFFVPANKRPYGVHCAGSVGFQIPSMARRGLGYPKKQISFHCAITPTPLERQPLVFFENAPVRSPNTAFLYDRLRSYDLSATQKAEVAKAFYLHDSGKLSQMDTVPVRDYLVARHWEYEYADRTEEGAGCYFECQPGQAVVFDNYRAHGDSMLPLSPTDRITIDIRCFSKVLYPEGIRSGLDLYVDMPEKKKEQKRRAIECLLMIFGYENMEEFLKLVYGSRHASIDPFEMLTDLQFGIYNKTPEYLLEQNLEAHYERCEKLYQQMEQREDFALPPRAKQAIEKLLATS
jgi:hypothetical protein